MASTQKKLLITGATGKQGGAAIEALQASNGTPFQILAMTRNDNSPTAKSLASKPNVTVVVGDSSKPEKIFEEHKPIYGVFAVTAIPSGNKDASEEAQGYALVDASIKYGVEHFVFTSVDRGGEKSENNPTTIPHFLAKHNIEEYMKAQITANGSKMQTTILRPVAFMENLTADFMGKGFASMWARVGHKPLQLIATSDISLFAARAFQNPAAYQGRAISLAGDELNFDQGKKVFKETIGYNMPETFWFVGAGIRYMSAEMGTMFKWFADDGYGADINALRKEEPKLQDFSTWLKHTSGFRNK
ncbi:putative NmrA-like family domain-containing protein 1 [Amylocarpus encephaloides]|uniref:NmrA-like family domain-containing protein 1 n=1 Tax=Amylocarpus encephaloides TaxID=45428 RepID=A0A9P8C0W9_9HELO|nr:putative NmrA-like family domain-containing protein 1 [Amylocarpus encephaloides]